MATWPPLIVTLLLPEISISGASSVIFWDPLSVIAPPSSSSLIEVLLLVLTSIVLLVSSKRSS